MILNDIKYGEGYSAPARVTQNTTIIGASADLLAALEGALERLEYDMAHGWSDRAAVTAKARAAIAKARGQS